MKEGDANTKLFQIVANGRRAKKFILKVKQGEEIATEQERKGQIFTKAYEDLLGAYSARDDSIDLDFLNIEGCDLQELEDIFTEEEVWNTIRELPSDRAPGPDGFIGAFY